MSYWEIKFLSDLMEPAHFALITLILTTTAWQMALKADFLVIKSFSFLIYAISCVTLFVSVSICVEL